MKLLKELTLYDICGDDHAIFARMTTEGEIEVEVWDQKEDVVYKEISHKHAWDSLVYFAKMVIQQDEFLNKKAE